MCGNLYRHNYLMKTDLMNIIFGLKVKKARLKTGMSLSAFAKACRLSPSYLTEIEKGRKYPKRDKIMKIANVTGVDYDQLVSIRLDPSLAYLESALTSPLIAGFPYEEFGVEMSSLVDLLTNAPEKVGALIHALIEIGRRFDVREEHFLRTALRSYQEMNDNFFPEIEDEADKAFAKYRFSTPVSLDHLVRVLEDEYGYDVRFDTLANDPDLSRLRSVMFRAGKRTLMVNNRLSMGQQLVAVAREIGICQLGLTQRSTTSPPRRVNSFDQVLNDFKASYFGGALLMPRDVILSDIETFFEQSTFQPERLQTMLDKYGVTPEILCYRLSELIPQHFGVEMHFLRFNDANGRYRVIKQLNLNNLPVPTGFGFKEHYCRRWLTVRLLQEMEGKEITPQKPLIGVQLSEFLDGSGHFLCFGFSRPLMLWPGTSASVILGFRVTPDLKDIIHFANDPAIPETMITGTCERCSLPKSECDLRAAEPEIWLKDQQSVRQREALKRLKARS